MDPDAELTAAEVVNTYDEKALTRILREFGEERFASRIAARIVRRRARRPFARTGELVELLYEAIPAPARRTGGHPAKRTFQALRIAVNGELDTLREALPAALAALGLGGRIVVMSYQSLEDRIVKNMFAAATASRTPPGLPVELPGHEPEFASLTRGAERASADEIELNPRSASGATSGTGKGCRKVRRDGLHEGRSDRRPCVAPMSAAAPSVSPPAVRSAAPPMHRHGGVVRAQLTPHPSPGRRSSLSGRRTPARPRPAPRPERPRRPRSSVHHSRADHRPAVGDRSSPAARWWPRSPSWCWSSAHWGSGWASHCGCPPMPPSGPISWAAQGRPIRRSAAERSPRARRAGGSGRARARRVRPQPGNDPVPRHRPSCSGSGGQLDRGRQPKPAEGAPPPPLNTPLPDDTPAPPAQAAAAKPAPPVVDPREVVVRMPGRG